MYLAMLFELDTPEWAGWTVISVSLTTRAASLQKSFMRAAAAIAGGVIALVLVAAFAQATLAFDVALALVLGVAGTLATIQRGQRTYGVASTAYTIPIVVLGSVQQPGNVFHIAVDRCSTIILGIVCWHASTVLVARGVRTMARNLAGTLETTVAASRRWIEAVQAGTAPAEGPPLKAVLALDAAIEEAFTEQASLRAGRRHLGQAPIQLLGLLALGFVRLHLPGADARALLGAAVPPEEGELGRLAALADLVEAGGREGVRRAPLKPLAIDWDGMQALRNGARVALAVSLTNAFWYVSGWPPGSGIVTWAALLSLLYATRDNGAEITRNFLVGGILAAAVGVALQYGVLASSYSFPQFAVVLMPALMLAALGHSEAQATFGGGYSFLLLNAVSPKNVMAYDLGATLNTVLATLLGMAAAVVSFTYLVPASPARVRRRRAQRRLAGGVRVFADRPSSLLPRRDRWLARMSARLALLEPGTEGHGGEVLLVVGLLLRALRDADDRFGRVVARAAWRFDEAALAELAAGAEGQQRDRVEALARLLHDPALADWPSGPRRRATS